MGASRKRAKTGQRATKKSETGKRLVQARVPEALYEWATGAAERENRSLGNFVLHLLDRERRREKGGEG